MPETARKRLLRYLNDALAWEAGSLLTLKDVGVENTDPAVLAAVRDHASVTLTQRKRLEARIKALGGKVERRKQIVNSLAAKSSYFVNIFHDKNDKRTQDLMKAYAAEQFEVAMYTSLVAYARAIGDTTTAELGSALRAEEEAAAQRLRTLVPRLARVPTATYSPSDAQKPSIASYLLLIPASVLAIWGLRQWMNWSPPPPPPRLRVEREPATVAPVAPPMTPVTAPMAAVTPVAPMSPSLPGSTI